MLLQCNNEIINISFVNLHANVQTFCKQRVWSQTNFKLKYVSIPGQHYQSGVLKLAIWVQSTTTCTQMDSLSKLIHNLEFSWIWWTHQFYARGYFPFFRYHYPFNTEVKCRIVRFISPNWTSKCSKCSLQWVFSFVKNFLHLRLFIITTFYFW